LSSRYTDDKVNDQEKQQQNPGTKHKLFVHEPAFWHYGTFPANASGKIPRPPFFKGGEKTALLLAKGDRDTQSITSGQKVYAWIQACWRTPPLLSHGSADKSIALFSFIIYDNIQYLR
jgi:hypothetical protein